MDTRVTIDRPAAESLTFLRHLTVSGRAPDKATIALSINGTAIGVGVCGQREPGRYEFINVPVSPGPQRITIAATSGGVTTEAAVTLHVQGPLAKLEIEGDERVPANPADLVTYTVRATDAWAKPVPDGAFVTLAVDRGVLETQDADPNTTGVQVRLVDGAASFQVRPANTAGPDLLKVGAGDVAATRVLFYTIPTRPLMVVGRLSTAVGIGYRTGPGGPPLEPGPGLSTDGRFRVFLRGSTENGYLLTGAMDSRRDLEDRLFKELDPDRMQPVFGDTSSVFYEGQSRDRFYLQLERDSDVYRYGDYLTGLAPGGYGAYQRALTGVRLQRATRNSRVVAFGATTRQSAERAEIRGNGTSGFYFLPNPPVVDGSERVWIEVRDRDRPQVILRSEFRVRLIDYDIDYQQGSLYFRQPVPGIDAQQNPVYIVAVYESRAPGAQRLITGLRGDARVGDFGLGSTLVREERSGRDYRLGSVDVSVRLPYQATLVTEYAATQADESGSAWRTELQAAPTKALKLRAYLSQATQDFENPSTAQFQVGSRNQGVDVAYEIDARSSAVAQLYRQSGGGTSLTTANGRYRYAFPRATTELELLHQGFSGGAGPSNESTLLSGLLRYPATGRLDLVFQREQELSGDNPLRPSGTTVGADYRIHPKIRFLAREKLTDDGDSIASVGVATELIKGTSLTSTYEINSVNNGGYNQANIGLNTVLPVTKFFTSNLAYERVLVFGNAPGHESASLGLEYKPTFPFIGTLKLERRRSAGVTQTGVALGGSGRVSSSLAVLFRHSRFANQGTLDARIGVAGVPSARTAVALAYRPANDRLNLLARYQIRDDETGLLVGVPAALSRAHIGALEGVYEPVAGWHFTGKYAFRRSEASTDGVTTRALTDFWLTRVTVDLSEQWNVSGEWRRLHQRETATEEHGYSMEVGYVVRQDAILGLGYNFSGETDPDFTDGARWSKGPYLRLGWKLDEDDVRSWLNRDGLIRAPRLRVKHAAPPKSAWLSPLGHPLAPWETTSRAVDEPAERGER